MILPKSGGTLVLLNKSTEKPQLAEPKHIWYSVYNTYFYFGEKKGKMIGKGGVEINIQTSEKVGVQN